MYAHLLVGRRMEGAKRMLEQVGVAPGLLAELGDRFEVLRAARARCHWVSRSGSGRVRMRPEAFFAIASICLISTRASLEQPRSVVSSRQQTRPEGEGFVALRMYGPLESRLDQSWRPSEIEPVDSGVRSGRIADRCPVALAWCGDCTSSSVRHPSCGSRHPVVPPDERLVDRSVYLCFRGLT